MKFEYNGNTYRIRFMYDHHGRDSMNQEVTVTIAFIERVQLRGQGWLISTGTAKQCSLDRFEKETGRKLALTRALDRSFVATMGGKAYRKLVWNAYHTRPGGALDKSKTVGEAV